jgi:hypothetical protein
VLYRNENYVANYSIQLLDVQIIAQQGNKTYARLKIHTERRE